MDWIGLRLFILATGWPVLITGSGFLGLRAWRFYRVAGRSAIGRLVPLMVAGWLSTMYALGLTATGFMLIDPERGVPIVLPVFVAWFLSMILVFVGLRWTGEVAEATNFYRNLEDLDRFKTQFFSSTAHEMGTPLTPIRVQLHLLRGLHSRESDPKLNSALDILDRNFQRLVRIVSEMQDVGRLHNRKLVLRPQRIDVRDILGRAADTYRPLANASKVRLDSPPPEPTYVWVDPDRTNQVLDNLLSNAIKFTPPGGTVRVRAEPKPDALVVTVEDTGPGFTQDQKNRLFQPFSQLHPDTHPKHAGSGLGLYICHGIVEQQGGKIWADSEGAGRGARFSFTMRLAS